MKKNLYSYCYRQIALILLFLIPIYFSAQVGVNTAEPNPNALLHVSERALSTDATANKAKGVLLPRLTEGERDVLTYVDATATPKVIKLTPKDDGLMIFNKTENCFNYWKAEENEWKSLCGSLGKSVFTIDCTNVIVNGKYSNNVELTSSNNIKLVATVTKPGTYNITAETENNNGYSFQASGSFLNAGTYTITLSGSGTPLVASTTGAPGDKIIINNDEDLLCDTTRIFINDSSILPEFTVDCQSAVVNGSYAVNTTLTSGNTITINIKSNSTAAGAPFEITTDVVNGYSYKATGILNGGNQQVTLIGEGKPTVNGTNNFILHTNSTLGASSCNLSVKVAAKKIKIVGLANTDNSYNIARSGNLLNQVLRNDNYFANNQTSTYPVSGFEFLELNSGTLTAAKQTQIDNFNPDIIFIQYNYYSDILDERNYLKSLLDKGVVIIYCSDGDGATATRNMAAQNMANLALGETGISATATVNSDLMEIVETNTLITSGPFMSLSGKSMGRDAGNNFGFSLTDFPFDKANVIAYQDANKTSIRGFVSKINGFVFFGDGAPFAANTGTEAYNWPAKFKTQNGVTTAIVNTYGTYPSYNSFLFLNLMAWAINYAQSNRPY